MPIDLMVAISVLGGLAFTLVTMVLYTLAHQLGTAIDRHELIRAARIQQQSYLRSVEERRRGVNADYDDAFDGAELVDEPEAAPARRAA